VPKAHERFTRKPMLLYPKMISNIKNLDLLSLNWENAYVLM